MTVIQCEPPGWRFEPSTRPAPLALASRLQFPKGTLLRSGYSPHGGMEGGEGGGLVCEENGGSQPIFLIFLLQPHTPYSKTQSIPNPLMDDDGAVVNSVIPHQKV